MDLSFNIKILLNDLQLIEIEEMEKNFKTEKNEILNNDLQFIEINKKKSF